MRRVSLCYTPPDAVLDSPKFWVFVARCFLRVGVFGPDFFLDAMPTRFAAILHRTDERDVMGILSVYARFCRSFSMNTGRFPQQHDHAEGAVVETIGPLVRKVTQRAVTTLRQGGAGVGFSAEQCAHMLLAFAQIRAAALGNDSKEVEILLWRSLQPRFSELSEDWHRHFARILGGTAFRDDVGRTTSDAQQVVSDVQQVSSRAPSLPANLLRSVVRRLGEVAVAARSRRKQLFRTTSTGGVPVVEQDVGDPCPPIEGKDHGESRHNNIGEEEHDEESVGDDNKPVPLSWQRVSELCEIAAFLAATGHWRAYAVTK